MLATMLKQGVAAVIGLTLAAPTGAGAPPTQTRPDLAQGDGVDPYGERAAFVQMVRATDSLPARGEP